MSNKKESVDASIIITAHAEGILTHRTLRSVKRAIKTASKYTFEVILHVDNATQETNEYIKANRNGILKDIHIFNNTFGDLGSSRNFAISQAKGKYVATIDADDLMSQHWLLLSLNELEKDLSQNTIAHSEFTIEFEGADSLIIKHGQIDTTTDTLLSVYANRWNSVIIAPRKILLKEKYYPNSPGFGYEDWHLNCRLIYNGVTNILIPKTAIFVRRKKDNSEWARQVQSMSVLRANPALSFDNIRLLPESSNFPLKSVSQETPSVSLKSIAVRVAKKYRITHNTALYIRKILSQRQRSTVKVGDGVLPDWLVSEWIELHKIDRQIFPSRYIKTSIPVYDTLTLEHKLAGRLYKQLVDSLGHNTYDYIFFVPWLIKGGADKYTIDYANQIAKTRENKRVLVIATLPVISPWKNRLSENVDFLDFGRITQEAPEDIKQRLMEHIIENSHASHLHVINSEFGYNFINLHKKYIRATNKKVIVTSFSQSVDSDGRIFGYSHTHVPFIYDVVDYISSDNQAVLDMWAEDYGFDKTIMHVHRQPISFNRTTTPLIDKDKIRLLWAARISPEKQPKLVSEIAKLANGVHIDMFGSIEPEYATFAASLPENVSYKGTFDGFATLPLEEYDALLYTSLFDGMPNTILEAAQHGLPVIASSVGGIPEFIQDQISGMLVLDIENPQAYANAISMIQNVEMREHLRTGAYDKLDEAFTSSNYTTAVESMLNALDF